MQTINITISMKYSNCKEESRQVFLKELIEILETDPEWDNYVSEVKIWAQKSREIIGV